MAKNIAIFGIYGHQEEAAKAVAKLREEGFRNTDVSVLLSNSAGNKDLAVDKSTKAPEGAVAGASSGAVLGGALAWLASIGTLMIPGIGPLIAAGPLMALLSGVGVGGAIGGFAGALIGAGIPEYEAKRYEGRVHAGNVLVSVHCDNSDGLKTAQRILEQTGAEDISSSSETAADFDQSDRTHARRHLASDHEADFRENFARTHDEPGASYEEFAPWYDFGFRMASDYRYRGRNFPDVEPELKIAAAKSDPDVNWERVSDAVLYGWEQAGGKMSGFVLI